MSMVEFYSAEDYEKARDIVSALLATHVARGTINVSFDMMSGSRKPVLDRLAMDIVCAIAKSDLAEDVPITGDISDMPGVNVERV